MTVLAKAIRAARGARSRREFAETIGATEGALYSWERGTYAPRIRPYINALVNAGVPKELFSPNAETHNV